MQARCQALCPRALRHSSWRFAARCRLCVTPTAYPLAVPSTLITAHEAAGALHTPRRWQSSVVQDVPEVMSDESHGVAAEEVMGDSSGAKPHNAEDAALIQVLHDAVPLGQVEAIQEMLKGAKNARELRHILENAVYKHHLAFDVLNGRGYRASILQALSSAATRTHGMPEWFECAAAFRRLGFVLTRAFAAEGFTLIRSWLLEEFNYEGRAPHLVTEGIGYTREFIRWCHEDGLVFDHVLYTRIIFILTMLVSFFDRQNLFRASFPPDFSKRDGVVVEWVVGVERCVDSDECILQCDAFLEEVLESMRHDLPSRPTFSVVYRLMDYYFATDNLEKMMAVMEDAQSYGVGVAESSTAKLMQLACFQNYPNAPQLFLKWRAALPQCVLAAPDMSRLMFFYGRAGGGRPCPVCGEAYNHRNASVYVWQQTPPHQRQCPALGMARHQKGELEECRALPQNSDWSCQAFQLWETSRARAIEWGAVEWRAFLLCCMFSPRAMEAKALVETRCPGAAMDDFLRATYIRLLRHHAPEEAVGAIQQWARDRLRMSPIVLQEGLMAAAMTANPAERLAALRYVWAALQEKDSYVMPFTRRFFEVRREALRQEAAEVSPEEDQLLDSIINMKPRHVSLLEMKDSAADFVVGSSKKNVFNPRGRFAAEGRSVSRVHAHGKR